MPGAGKTTVARGLAAELKLPLVTKDVIKERMYDELGVGDVEWSRRVGSAAYALIFAFARELLVAGQPLIAEANFFRGSHEDHFAALPPHRLVQIHCSAPPELLRERYRSRTDRHPGHLDHERESELDDRIRTGLHDALALEGEVVEVDTSRPVKIEAIAARIRSIA